MLDQNMAHDVLQTWAAWASKDGAPAEPGNHWWFAKAQRRETRVRINFDDDQLCQVDRALAALRQQSHDHFQTPAAALYQRSPCARAQDRALRLIVNVY